VYRYFTTATSSEIIVYNSTNTITVGVRSGHNLWVYSENENIDEAVTRHISALGLRAIPELSVSLPATIKFMNYQLLLSEYYSDDLLLSKNPDAIITKKVPLLFNPPVKENKLKILVTSGSANVIILATDDVTNDQDNIYFIPDDGAQIINRAVFRKKGVEIID
jgi:hypothetical protein